MTETHVHFRDRAASFHSAISILTDCGLLDDPLRQRLQIASGLLAVHCAIAYADTLMTLLTGQHVHPDQHDQAADLLGKACKDRQLNKDGVAHFSRLLGKKNMLAYDNRRIDTDTVRRILLDWERFCAWCFRTCPDLEAPGSQSPAEEITS